MKQAWEVFRFELAYQLRRVSTRIYFAIFLALALALTWAIFLDARNDGYFFNAPIVTGLMTIVASMLALLVAAGVAGDAATRDAQMRIAPLFFTTPLRKGSYLGGRFLGAFAINALLLLAIPIGLFLATLIPGIEPQVLGPFRAEAYLASYFFLAVPNAFIATAVLFSIAVLTRRAIAAYAGAALLFFSAFIVEGFVGVKLGKWALAKLLDPLGYTAVHALWRTYNPLQKNTLPVDFNDALVSNRLLWMAVAFGVLALARIRFRVMSAGTTGSQPVIETRRAESPSLQITPRRVFNMRTRIRQLLAIAMDAFRELHKSRGWLIVPFTAVLFIVTAAEVLEVELGTPGAATTSRVAALFAADELTRLVALLIAISAGELVWRERDARMNAIADVTPVPEWLSFLGRFLALGLMLAVTEAIFLASSVIVQVMSGPTAFELVLYLKILFGFPLTGYLLFAALALVIHVVVNQKYVGNVIAMVAYVGVQLARELGVRHNLLLYGSAPEPAYSEMSGFGLQVGPWFWFTLYWSGWALLFGVAAYLLWMRGEERGVRWRLALARRRLTRWPIAIGAIAIAIIAGAGGFVFYNTNVLNHYYSDAALEEKRAEYERRYGRYASLAQPTLGATKLHIEFYPARNAAAIRGTYRLENRTNVAIDAIHVVANSAVPTKDISFDRPSRVTLRDDGFGTTIYALGKAVQPGESISMNFRVDYAPRGFTNGGWNPSVVGNGSWIQHRAEQAHSQRQWLPFVGYQANRELNNAAARRRHGLRAARNDQQGQEKIELETIIGTAPDQTGVAPGVLRRTWTENGRQYFHYATDAPITNVYAIYSAHYAIRRAQWRDVAIEILYHPTHTANLERMLRSVTASLDYHTRHYSPYPHKMLRLIEYPSSGRALGLTSYPGLIEYSEAFALVRPGDDPRKIDLPFAVMAHEMGHQWWGHQLVPANVEGAPLLSESLAWYSAMLVVEKNLGRDHLLRLLDIMRAEYMAPHQTRDVPLLRSYDPLDAYRTGPFAMFALREAVGADRVNAALREMLSRPHPTSLDLYAELRAATPRHSLLKDLFEDITFWDLRTKKVDVQRIGPATYRVTLHISAEKLKADAYGKEKPVLMNDPIEVAVFAADGHALYRHPHAIRSGEQTITIDVTAPPARAGLDPDHELLDRQPEDNDAACQTGPSADKRAATSRVTRRTLSTSSSSMSVSASYSTRFRRLCASTRTLHCPPSKFNVWASV